MIVFVLGLIHVIWRVQTVSARARDARSECCSLCTECSFGGFKYSKYIGFITPINTLY